MQPVPDSENPSSSPGVDPQFRPPRRLSARWAALRALSDLREGRKTARQSIDELLAGAQLPAEETGFAIELVMGVIRHRMTLAKVLGSYTRHGWQRVGRQLQHVLMLGAYQILWLDSVPSFAAVNEAVEQAKADGGGRSGPFVNAVLRQLQRDIETPRMPLEQADPRRAVLLDGHTCCQLRRPVLSDPTVNLVGFLGEAFSHPTWLIGRWIAHYGRATTEAICRYGMTRPATMLRPNRLRCEAPKLAKLLSDEGFTAEVAPAGHLVITGSVAGLMRTKAFAQGLFQPQDPTAMKPVEQMKLQPGQVVIDLCAGVGTKTGQMAERMGNKGMILASDIQPTRLEALMRNCSRLGLDIVQPVAVDQLAPVSADLKRLDWILIDAPCSNTGVLARRPEARYRADRRSVEALTAVQLGLLRQAAGLARAETLLLYSTCSLEPEENEQLAAAFAKAHPDWRLEASELTLPSADGPATAWRDGGYWSIWRRAQL